MTCMFIIAFLEESKFLVEVTLLIPYVLFCGFEKKIHWYLLVRPFSFPSLDSFLPLFPAHLSLMRWAERVPLWAPWFLILIPSWTNIPWSSFTFHSVIVHLKWIIFKRQWVYDKLHQEAIIRTHPHIFQFCR